MNVTTCDSHLTACAAGPDDGRAPEGAQSADVDPLQHGGHAAAAPHPLQRCAGGRRVGHPRRPLPRPVEHHQCDILVRLQRCAVLPPALTSRGSAADPSLHARCAHPVLRCLEPCLHEACLTTARHIFTSSCTWAISAQDSVLAQVGPELSRQLGILRGFRYRAWAAA